jgi:hypothetical protein
MTKSGNAENSKSSRRLAIMARCLSRFVICLLLAVVLTELLPASILAQQATPPDRQSRPRILAHYMPWFEAKPHNRDWGWHWTMNTFDPGGTKTGKPQIASHYHPLIGPYGSGDTDVLEYHVLTMKLAGIDGIIVDWYGTADLFDYAINHQHTLALIDHVSKAGLAFAVCYEDQTIPKLVEHGRIAQGDRVKQARLEIDWLKTRWFSKPSYLKLGGKAVLLSFGRIGLTDAEWREVLSATSDTVLYLSEHDRRPGAAGAFDWPVPQAGLTAQESFYKNAPQWPVAVPVAFPRFHDIYEEAKVHKSWGKIDDNGGKTFATTLEKALQSGTPLVQIATWNDWGEGTVIEPSAEFGYRDLEVVQRLRRQHIEPEFSGKPDDLRLPLGLLRLRRKVGKGSNNDRRLDEVAQLLLNRSFALARGKLGALGK